MKLKHSLFIVVFAVIISVLSAISIMAEPITGTCGNSSVTYEISDGGTLTVAGNGAMPSYKDSDAPWSAYTSNIHELVIQSGVTEIGECAFVNITANASVPDSVTKIGDHSLGYLLDGNVYGKITGYVITGSTGSAAEQYASDNGFTFKSTTPKNIEGVCGNGVTFTLTPDGILTISGNGTMYSFSSNAPAWNAYTSGEGAYVIREVNIKGNVTSIGDKAFKNCSSLTKVTVDAAITSIGKEAFANCTKLNELIFPTTVTSIGTKAFSYCTSLKTVPMSILIETIGENAFEFSGITSIEIPVSLKTAGEKLFYGCTFLKSAMIFTAVVPDRIFAECNTLETVTFINDVKEIGEKAFEGCTSLASVSSGSLISKIGAYAFEGCSSLSQVNFVSDTTEFSPYCFRDCTSLEMFSFSDSTKLIPKGMFYGCISLTNVTLGDSITVIGDHAFVGCTSMKNIFVSYKVRQIGQYAIGFMYRNGNYLSINGVEIEGFTPSVAKTYAEENEIKFVHYKTVDTDSGEVCEGITWKFRPATGVLNIIGKGAMPDYTAFEETPWYVYRTYIKHVTFSSGIVNIGASSFEGCSTIEQIDIAGSVELIGASAFAGTSIVTATIPMGVKEIGNSAFEGCKLLYTILLPDSLTKIGDAAFKGPNSVNTVYVPSGVSEIGTYALGYDANNGAVHGFLIKGTEGSTANRYADTNGLSFIVNGFVQIEDNDSGCTVSILGDSAFGYKLGFTKLSNGFSPELLIPSDQTVLQYEIKLTFDDQNARIDGSAEISFPIPDGMLNRPFFLYCVTGSGDFSDIGFSCVDGVIVFSHASLGKFVLSTVDLSQRYNITVNYKYADGSTAKDTLTVQAVNGAEYRFTAEGIKGYSLNEYAFTGTVDGADITVEFVYTKSSSAPSAGNKENKDNGAGTKVLVTVLLIVLAVALIAAAVLLIYLGGKKKRQQHETGKTMRAAAKKPSKPDVLANTIVIPDFATREIDIESLFADEPEEDLEAAEEIRKKQLQSDDNKK